MHWKIELKRLSHHAYCIEGDADIRIEIMEFLESELGVKTSGNPDFFVLSKDTFTIDDARFVYQKHIIKALGDRGRYFLLLFGTITAEAQNAMLKTLEDPVPHNYFILQIPNVEILLPTVRSRMLIFRYGEKRTGHLWDKEADNFLSSELPDRLKFIKDVAKKIEDDKIQKSDAMLLIQALERAFRSKLEKVSREDGKKLAEILRAESQIRQNGSSIKLLMENIAITLPVIGSR